MTKTTLGTTPPMLVRLTRDDLTITTTDRTKFVATDHYDLARLVFKRFGHDPEAGAAAWRRMLQNSATVEDFMGLINAPTHTPHCEGSCQNHSDD